MMTAPLGDDTSGNKLGGHPRTAQKALKSSAVVFLLKPVSGTRERRSLAHSSKPVARVTLVFKDKSVLYA
jgi:hypothetical protein